MWFGIFNAILGLWMMFSPHVFNYSGSARNNDLIMGPLLVTFACISIWPVLRQMRGVTLLIGIWHIIASLVFDYGGLSTVNGIAIGVVTSLFSFLQPSADLKKFGGGWRYAYKNK